MECGAQDYVCQVATWISENENLATYVTEVAGHIGAGSSGFFKLIAQILENHGQAIVGLLGLSFGFLKWWRYREQILHKRLDEYLKESDFRLKEGERYVLDALQRPGPSTRISLPLFADRGLRSVLRERNWDRTTTALNVESSADWQLTEAIGKIQRQIQTAENNIRSLKQQFATAHILKGAIASSVAERSPHRAADRNNVALNAFRTALQVKGYQADHVAKELEAHQLRKMGHADYAMAAYEDLERLAKSIEDEREQAIIVARAKRYRAEIIQAAAAQLDDKGVLQFAGRTTASDLVSNRTPNSALDIRAAHLPYIGWDLVEEGEMNYVGAFLSHNLKRSKIERDHLDDAETAYRTVLTSTPQRRLWEPFAVRRIKREAKKGLGRVVLAREGVYATEWLVLPTDVRQSNVLEQKT